MLKMIKAAAVAVIALSTLTGCATIVNGTKQNVAINTIPAVGARCSLENNKGKWIVKTPATVTVNRSYGDLFVRCNKPGFQQGAKVVQSKTKAMAFGNLVFGGIIGTGVDMADGAAYDYPNDIFVPMKKEKV